MTGKFGLGAYVGGAEKRGTRAVATPFHLAKRTAATVNYQKMLDALIMRYRAERAAGFVRI